jgi:hypothetical protein
MWNISASWSGCRQMQRRVSARHRLLHQAAVSHVFGVQENSRDRDGLGWKVAAP